MRSHLGAAIHKHEADAAFALESQLELGEVATEGAPVRGREEEDEGDAAPREQIPLRGGAELREGELRIRGPGGASGRGGAAGPRGLRGPGRRGRGRGGAEGLREEGENGSALDRTRVLQQALLRRIACTPFRASIPFHGDSQLHTITIM